MRILYLCPCYPYPPNRGDRIRNHSFLRALATAHDVTLAAFAEPGITPPDPTPLSQMLTAVHVCERSTGRVRGDIVAGALAGYPLNVAYFRNSHYGQSVRRLLQSNNYDLVISSLIRTAQYCGDTNIPVIVDLTDCLSWNYRQRAASAKGVGRALWGFEAWRTAKYERRLLQRFPHCLTCSPLDREEFVRLVPGCNPVLMPNVVDTDFFEPPAQRALGHSFVFVGAMGYTPNEDAALAFANNVLPLIRREIPDATFVVVGSNPTEAVKRLAALEGVTVTGEVPDVRPYLHAARVFAAPLRLATGTQTKLLQAMACGLPTITTERARLALGLSDSEGLFAADDWERFAQLAVRLCRDDQFHAQAAESCRQAVVARYSWDHISERLLATVEDVARAAR